MTKVSGARRLSRPLSVASQASRAPVRLDDVARVSKLANQIASWSIMQRADMNYVGPFYSPRTLCLSQAGLIRPAGIRALFAVARHALTPMPIKLGTCEHVRTS